MNGGGSSGESESAGSTPVDDSPAASDAFQVLASEARTDILRALADAEPCTFSDLHERSDEDTSAGFAYHLRQLTGRFVRQRDDERYERTHAGREVSRSIRAGTYTDSVDRECVELDEECPHCASASLVARVADNVTEIRCTDCESPVLALSLPPSGYADRDAESLPNAIDAYHRRRIATFADGVCPDCGGPVETGMELPEEQTDDDAHGPVQVGFECETCGTTLRCPVSLTVLDHPAVVSLFQDHGRDVGDRPIWNVGPEWGECVVSRDPWCIVVSVALDGEALFLYVAGDGTVVEARRHDPDDDIGSPAPTSEATTDAVDADASDDIEAGGESAGADGATV